MSIKPLAPLEPKVSATVETPLVAENTSLTPTTVEGILSLVALLTQQNQLMQQQLAASQQAAIEANEKLASAILKTTEPRAVIRTQKEIAQELNEKMFLEQAKELEKRKRENKDYEQSQCEHIAGSQGDTKDVHQRTSIVWHRTDAQVDIGVCTCCGRQFHPEDPLDKQGRDYSYWRRKGSFNRISAAGVRQFMDPLKAQHDSYLRDS